MYCSYHFPDDCLWVMRIISLDLIQKRPMILLLKVTFVGLTILTMLQPYHITNINFTIFVFDSLLLDFVSDFLNSITAKVFDGRVGQCRTLANNFLRP
jgi:hypothetical protein